MNNNKKYIDQIMLYETPTHKWLVKITHNDYVRRPKDIICHTYLSGIGIQLDNSITELKPNGITAGIRYIRANKFTEITQNLNELTELFKKIYS